ncbi:MAG: alpha/beta fold hydrolase [Vampirovibrionales bacterium]|nr:alpha/beta fold hydrolase [Vampirovibrionales bacterium]
MASKSSAFKTKAVPWMYSTLGSAIAAAFIKLSPIHRRLSQLEIENIRDFFASDFVSPEKRRNLSRFSAFIMTYFNAIARVAGLSREARQDYYALQRQGCFVSETLSERPPEQLSDPARLPILVIPGLNTPPAFFREMHRYFSGKGYPVIVMNLPAGGLSDIASSVEAVRLEIKRIQEVYSVKSLNVIGHCLGGLIAHYGLESKALLGTSGETSSETSSPQPLIQNLVSLGTGFLGADGVEQLKGLWIPRNPGKPIPKVFDELIQANMNIIRHSTEVTRHNLLTIWDFMVHFRKGLLETPLDNSMAMAAKVFNHIIDDPNIDHLTLALHPSVFEKIETLLQTAGLQTTGLQTSQQSLLPAMRPVHHN